MRLPKWLIVFLACVSLAIAGEQSPLVSGADVALSGNFERGGADPATKPLSGEQTFGSFSSSGLTHGKLTTGAFLVPDAIELRVAGFPLQAGARIYLRDEKAPSRTLDLQTRENPAYLWRLRVWAIPLAWRGQRVRMILEDTSAGSGYTWVGFTLPRSSETVLSKSLFRAVWRACLLIFAAAGLLAPALAIAMRINRWLRLRAPQYLILVLVIAGVLGYLTFWAYFANATLGKILSTAIVVSGCCGLGVQALLFRKHRRPFDLELLLPLGSAVLVAILYSSLAYVYLSDEHAGIAMQTRFFAYSMPLDNMLPEILADQLYHSRSLRQSVANNWQTSDRPPLQAGLVLMELPFWAGSGDGLEYELISIFLQCSWVLAVWILLRSAGLSVRRILPVTAICIFSGFCFLHSVYVWPKLLAASYCLMGFSFFVARKDNARTLTLTEWILAFLCFGLSLLSHTGAAFTLFGVFVLLSFERATIVWRRAAAGIACFLLLLLPWFAFQKLYDPPGDQLLKANLTGAMNHDLSLSQSFAVAYRGMTAQEFLRRRLRNVEVLFVKDAKDLIPSLNLQDQLTHFNSEQFFAFFYALGLLNVGFLLRLLPHRRRGGEESVQRLADRLLIAVGASLLLWILVMYDPGATVIHQGSLANLLLAFIACSLYIGIVFPRGIFALVLLQAICLYPLTVFSRPVLQSVPGSVFDGRIDPGMLLMAGAALCGLIVIGWRAASISEPQLV